METTFMDMLRKLEIFGTINVSALEVREFTTFCNNFGVHPHTVEILGDSSHKLAL